MYKYDIYAAGPFFNDQQKEVMDRAIKGLRGMGYSVCDPRDLNPVLVDMPPEDRKKHTRQIFESNVHAIDQSYMVVACIDDRDTGTAFELGHVNGRIDTRHFGFVTFSGFGHGCNVMLSEPSQHHWEQTYQMLEGMAQAWSLIQARTAGGEEYARLWGSVRVKAEAVE